MFAYDSSVFLKQCVALMQTNISQTILFCPRGSPRNIKRQLIRLELINDSLPFGFVPHLTRT